MSASTNDCHSPMFVSNLDPFFASTTTISEKMDRNLKRKRRALKFYHTPQSHREALAAKIASTTD